MKLINIEYFKKERIRFLQQIKTQIKRYNKIFISSFEYIEEIKKF